MNHFIFYTSAPLSATVVTREEIHAVLDQLIGQDTLRHLEEEGEASDLTLLAEIASNEYQVFKVYDRQTVNQPSAHPFVQHLAQRLGWM
jgi:hypothetical protein